MVRWFHVASEVSVGTLKLKVTPRTSRVGRPVHAAACLASYLRWSANFPGPVMASRSRPPMMLTFL